MTITLPTIAQIRDAGLDPAAELDQLIDEVVEVIVDVNGGVDEDQMAGVVRSATALARRFRTGR